MTDDEVLERARSIAAKRLRRRSFALCSPVRSSELICPMIGNEPKEVFLVVYLDSRHRVIRHERVFTGTLNTCAVYPREVVRGALLSGAGAVILAHNHPSGDLQASRADRDMTEKVREALSTIDVRVLDHLIVNGAEYVSFVERGFL